MKNPKDRKTAKVGKGKTRNIRVVETDLLLK